jgi:capsular polysaccharide biosynthesis protein
MSIPADPKILLRSQKIYERLLVAYPKAHRAEYGAAMSLLFRDQCRDAWNEAGRRGLTKLWLRVLPDLVSTSILERLAALNERKSMTDKLANLLGFRATPGATFFRIFAVVFSIVFLTSIAITFILPESYASTARIRVEPDAPTVDGQPLSYDPYFIQTTFEILQSQIVLSPVVEKLNLNEKWGKKYFNGETLKTAQSLDLLKARLDLRPVRSTKLVNITVYSEDRNDAAQIANAIAQSYQNYRFNQVKQLSLNGIKILEDQWQQEEALIQQSASEMESLRRQYNIGSDVPVPRAPQEQPYWDKKRKWENLRESHKLLAARIETKRLDLMSPKTSPAEIADQAQPGLAPVRPNKPLNITLGAIAGILLASIVGAMSAFVVFQLGKRRRNSPGLSVS